MSGLGGIHAGDHLPGGNIQELPEEHLDIQGEGNETGEEAEEAWKEEQLSRPQREEVSRLLIEHKPFADKLRTMLDEFPESLQRKIVDEKRLHQACWDYYQVEPAKDLLREARVFVPEPDMKEALSEEDTGFGSVA